MSASCTCHNTFWTETWIAGYEKAHPTPGQSCQALRHSAPGICEAPEGPGYIDLTFWWGTRQWFTPCQNKFEAALSKLLPHSCLSQCRTGQGARERNSSGPLIPETMKLLIPTNYESQSPHRQWIHSLEIYLVHKCLLIWLIHRRAGHSEPKRHFCFPGTGESPTPMGQKVI